MHAGLELLRRKTYLSVGAVGQNVDAEVVIGALRFLLNFQPAIAIGPKFGAIGFRRGRSPLAQVNDSGILENDEPLGVRLLIRQKFRRALADPRLNRTVQQVGHLLEIATALGE